MENGNKTNAPNYKTALTDKLIIRGKIKTLTGLHIGGSKSSMQIGGVDLSVIKTPQGVPIIPGSSLKGKIRSLLAKVENSGKAGDDPQYMQEIFGNSGSETRESYTRLIVRDAVLNTESFKNTFKEHSMDFQFSEVKMENTINRASGTAQHPREIERVPSGAFFDFEIVYDIYEDAADLLSSDSKREVNGVKRLFCHLEALKEGMLLLQDDYLGGNGSRGYGKIEFSDIRLQVKNMSNKCAHWHLKAEAEGVDFLQVSDWNNVFKLEKQ